MKFLGIMNREIPLGEAINAMAHMTLGLGHRLKGEPQVSMFFGTSAQVRTFRSLATTIAHANDHQAAFSDFPHTMSGGDTDKQLEVGLSTPEADITYYGSCFISSEIDPRLLALTQSCSQLIDYTPHISSTDSQASLLAPRTDYSASATDRKIVMLINHKLSLAATINAAVLCSLGVGYMADFPLLRLLSVQDKDGTMHPNISYHPYPILKPSDPNKHLAMAGAAEKEGAICAKTLKNAQSQPLATVVFGSRSLVESVILRKQTRFFDTKLTDDMLTTPVAQEKDRISAAALVDGASALFASDNTVAASSDVKLTEVAQNLSQASLS